MNKANLIILFSLLITFQSQAGSCSTQSCDAKITELYIHENTNIYIKIDADQSQLDNLICTVQPGGIILEKTHTMQSEIYSALLSSTMSEKLFRIRTNLIAGEDCKVVYVKIWP